MSSAVGQPSLVTGHGDIWGLCVPGAPVAGGGGLPGTPCSVTSPGNLPESGPVSWDGTGEGRIRLICNREESSRVSAQVKLLQPNFHQKSSILCVCVSIKSFPSREPPWAAAARPSLLQGAWLRGGFPSPTAGGLSPTQPTAESLLQRRRLLPTAPAVTGWLDRVVLVHPVEVTGSLGSVDGAHEPSQCWCCLWTKTISRCLGTCRASARASPGAWRSFVSHQCWLNPPRMAPGLNHLQAYS